MSSIVQKKRRISLVAALVAALVAGALSPSYAFLDKTRFAAHLGIAYFCFHHWVMRPYTEGAFNDGAPHRTATIVKGGAALLFAIHEVQVAEKIAHTSKDPLLQKVDGGVQTLMTGFSTVGQKLKSGHFDPKDIQALQTQATAVTTEAAAGGVNIKDVPAALPGT